jgi:hypothetical protein
MVLQTLKLGVIVYPIPLGLEVVARLDQAADCPSGLVEVNPSDPAVVFRLGPEEDSQLGQVAVSPLGQAVAKR